METDYLHLQYMAVIAQQVKQNLSPLTRNEPQSPPILQSEWLLYKRACIREMVQIREIFRTKLFLSPANFPTHTKARLAM